MQDNTENVVETEENAEARDNNDALRSIEIIEAILFGAGHPVSYDKLAETLGMTVPEVKDLLDVYENRFRSSGFPTGLQFIRFDKACQLCTKSEYEEYVKNALGIRRGKGSLSNSSLEVLAIVAYHQPVTRAYIEQVRGVDSSYAIAVLQEKNLIEKKGRLDVPGRPSLFGTTLDFLRSFGLSSIKELPKVEELESENDYDQLSFDDEEVSGENAGETKDEVTE